MLRREEKDVVELLLLSEGAPAFKLGDRSIEKLVVD